MTRKNIITLPNPRLRQRSQRVGFIDEEARKLANDMMSASLDWEDHRKNEVAVALAAIQIGQPRRIVIVRNSFNDPKDRTFSIYINPKIVKTEGELVHELEGCLSVKDIYGKVPRYTKVKIAAQTEDGQEVRFTATDFLARVFQHEIDHTNGKLFIDHVAKQQFYKLGEEGELIKLDDDEKHAIDILRQ